MLYSIFSVQDHYPGCSRSVPQFYSEILAQAEWAERCGYDAFFVAEHHFHEYGVVPNPAVMLAAISQRTSRIRLGSAISAVTFHNPLTVAENYAMLDILSNGRLLFGVGSGYLPHEYAGYGIDSATKRERFDENLGIIERALRGQSIPVEGCGNTVSDVIINVLPSSAAGIPLYIAILRPEVAFHIGRQGRNFISVPYASVNSLDGIADMITDYGRGAREAGHQAGDAIFAMHALVADTDSAAREAAEPSFRRYVESRLYAREQTYDELVASGLGLFGSVATVARGVLQLQALGVRHLMLLQNFGLMPHESVRRSMEMFMTQVAPLVQEQIADLGSPLAES